MIHKIRVPKKHEKTERKCPHEMVSKHGNEVYVSSIACEMCSHHKGFSVNEGEEYVECDWTVANETGEELWRKVEYMRKELIEKKKPIEKKMRRISGIDKNGEYFEGDVEEDFDIVGLLHTISEPLKQESAIIFEGQTKDMIMTKERIDAIIDMSYKMIYGFMIDCGIPVSEILEENEQVKENGRFYLVKVLPIKYQGELLEIERKRREHSDRGIIVYKVQV